MFVIAAAETPKGWGGTVAIVVFFVAAALIKWGDVYYRNRWGKPDGPSPTETGAPLPLETSQVRRVSSHVSPDETPAEPDKTQWWGSMQNVGGTLKRVYHDARHIAATGDSPVQAYGDDTDGAEVDADDMLDLPLGGNEGDDIEHEEMEVHTSRETREEYVERCVEAGLGKATIAKALIEHYGLSRATAYRVVEAVMSRQQAA
jgi:hypothetical protein